MTVEEISYLCRLYFEYHYMFVSIRFAIFLDTSHCPANIRAYRYLHEYMDSCVLFVRNKKSWQDARNYCRKLGGDLVTIKDANKQQFILKYLTVDHWDTDNIWIGLTDQSREGDWRWVDGSYAFFFSVVYRWTYVV